MTHLPVIDLWPTLADFADDLSIAYGTAKAMRRRGVIPSQYWEMMVEAAERRNITGVSYAFLAKAVSKKNTSSPVSSSAGESAGASLPQSDAPAVCQGRAEAARLTRNQKVAGSGSPSASSFQSPDFLPSGVKAGARCMDDAGRAPATFNGERIR